MTGTDEFELDGIFAQAALFTLMVLVDGEQETEPE